MRRYAPLTCSVFVVNTILQLNLLLKHVTKSAQSECTLTMRIQYGFVVYIHLLCCCTQGAGSQEFAQQLRQHFNKVAWARPAATRSESREIYLLGLGRKS